MNIFKRKKEKTKSIAITNEAGMLFARLLFDNEQPAPDQEAILKEVKKHFSSVDCSTSNNNKTLQYFFKDYPVTFAEGIIPAQCVMLFAEKKTSLAQDLDKFYAQQWHWDEAREKTSNFQSEILINDLMSRPLPYKKRVEMFQKFLYAAARTLNPTAIYFPSSEKIIPTNAYLERLDQDGFTSLFGLVNVRFFSIKQDDSYFMDTLGMHTLGLPDFQIHYKNLVPTDVAGVLYSYVDYIFNHGSVIMNGNTIEGTEQGSIWECLYQGASMAPKRNVLHLNIKN